MSDVPVSPLTGITDAIIAGANIYYQLPQLNAAQAVNECFCKELAAELADLRRRFRGSTTDLIRLLSNQNDVDYFHSRGLDASRAIETMTN